MGEGIIRYTRWEGELYRRPALVVIVEEEIRRALRNSWAQAILILSVGYTAIYLGEIRALVQSRGVVGIHTWETFLTFLRLLLWGSLGIASIASGPALLEDDRRSALELYYSRPVRKIDYLGGKSLAVLLLSFGVVWVPGFLYWGASYFLFSQQPDGWEMLPFTSFVYALLWSLAVSGLGLGLSAVARSSRGATLFLFGGVAVLGVLLSDILEAITRSPYVQILSPLSALQAQETWLFNLPPSFPFPYWWGLVHLAIVGGVGWGLVALRHPKIKGVES